LTKFNTVNRIDPRGQGLGLAVLRLLRVGWILKLNYSYCSACSGFLCLIMTDGSLNDSRFVFH